MLKITVTCLLLGFASAAQSGQSVSPVQKVIELLEENKVKITNDLAAEEKEMKEYTDFCDKDSSEKGYAIETATRTLEDLAGTITDCESKIPALADTVAELGSEVASKQKQLYEATEVRKKEKADFDDAEKELMTSIDQLTRAVTIIKRETAAGSFVQVSGSTKSRSQGLELAMSVLSRIIDAGRINLGSGRTLEAFMQTDDEQPQAKEVAYESKSGGIIAKIEEMKEKAEETLTGSRNTEMKAQQDFAMLEQSLNDGISVAMEKISNAKKSIGAKTEQLGQAKGDSQETQASKAADEKYLQELKHDCSEASANWAQRQESATAEMGAIDKAIQILSEGVRVLLQTKQTTSKRVSNNNLEKYDSEFDDASQGTESKK
jgi:predicted  nucleic acid-binding Zn-ribbon protein